MAQGLDELIEWLVGEVAFYGDGESTLDFILGITRNRGEGEKKPQSRGLVAIS